MFWLRTSTLVLILSIVYRIVKIDSFTKQQFWVIRVYIAKMFFGGSSNQAS